MTEEIKTLTEQGMEKALAYIEATESFVAEQAPLLVQEVLRYGLVSESIPATILAVLVVGFGTGSWFSFKELRKDHSKYLKDHDKDLFGFFGVITAAISLGCFICLYRMAFTLAKIIFAPRLYLIETLSALI